MPRYHSIYYHIFIIIISCTIDDKLATARGITYFKGLRKKFVTTIVCYIEPRYIKSTNQQNSF